MTVVVRLGAGVITNLSFLGSGCAVSVAWATLMTEALMGKTPAPARELAAWSEGVIRRESGALPDLGSATEPAVFAAISDHPARAPCAELAWQTALCALCGASSGSL